MTLDIAGATAIGLVCGWWCAPLSGTRAPWRSWSAVAAAMVVLALQALWLGGAGSALGLLIGFVIAFVTHAVFRTWLFAQVAHDRR
jgi:hypothetical protein